MFNIASKEARDVAGEGERRKELGCRVDLKEEVISSENWGLESFNSLVSYFIEVVKFSFCFVSGNWVEGVKEDDSSIDLSVVKLSSSCCGLVCCAQKLVSVEKVFGSIFENVLLFREDFALIFLLHQRVILSTSTR